MQNRIRDLERQQEQILEVPPQKVSPRGGAVAQTVAPNSKFPMKHPGSVKKQQPNSPTKLMNNTANGFNMGSPETFSFAAITRDHYYSVHGEKRAVPKNGNYYPRFDIVER